MIVITGITDLKFTSLPTLLKNILKKTRIPRGEHGMSGWEKNVLLHGIFFSSLEREDRSLRLHMCLYKNSDL